MTYRIKGLDPKLFSAFVGADEAYLRHHNAVRVTATSKPGFPCRVSLEDAEPGEMLILLNHVSHDVASPYRTAHAIFVREQADASPVYVDSVPPVFAGRTLSLRAFDADGMLREAALAMPGEADDAIRTLLADADIAYIDAHNAAPGCFAARIERDDDQ